MRIFLVAVTVFLLVTALLILDMLYVTQTMDMLHQNLSRFPSTAEAVDRNLSIFQKNYNAFYNLFSDREKILHILCGHTETDRVREAFSDMAERYLAGDDAGYRSAKSRLETALQNLRDAEQLSLDNFM